MTEPAHPPDTPTLPTFPAPAFGSAAELLGRITVRLDTQLGALRPSPAPSPRRPPVHQQPTLVAVARDSRDPRALHTALSLLERVRERRPRLDVRLGHLGPTRPRLADSLSALSGVVPREAAVQRRGSAAGAPGPAAAPLGDHPALIRLALLRYDAALAGREKHPHPAST
ncbi:hypothetical protein [Streptomyces subrutilus]|uniref:Uncharacterized protein n=1 Tax=Streptomyces subrutilus TaxID=36818 RepID=A0A5P2UNH3_9ACTN|nr:hypothetical protein [Streptomyces subrutilus]QEU80708.1 hypothetical protein CP968_22620 [Streptomyces subrutilus]WSJ30007.1 hypothetical protein OG479_12200 [Streptomyces subrutilus]GGZ74113.1 hypothetical protein GCM10010371_37340 [Streptomyces subrutilus]